MDPRCGAGPVSFVGAVDALRLAVGWYRVSRLVVVSAHLDDGCLSAGEAIAAWPDVTVLTVLAGDPGEGVGLTSYDEMCGFGSSTEAVAERKIENREACEVLGASPADFAFLDGQYLDKPRTVGDAAEMIAALTKVFATLEPEIVLLPLGIGHRDHSDVARAGYQAVMDQPWIAEVLIYEDLPYRVLRPNDAVNTVAIAQLTELVPLSNGTSLERKLEAIQCYRSQLSENIERCCRVPERIWRLR